MQLHKLQEVYILCGRFSGECLKGEVLRSLFNKPPEKGLCNRLA